jgi:2-polyprenyl-3-methyl-5-hydroxy-6-metoxy-1,4-benzoquinol methylase
VRAALRLLDPLLGGRLAEAAARAWLSAVARREPEAALRRLLPAYDRMLARIDLLAIELDGGVHAKHRLTGYHDFFVDRIRSGERVLDVGCGKGELALDIARRARARVTGIDLNESSLAFARSRAADVDIEFVRADALEWLPPGPYDVVVLSNVLEHLAPRVELLTRLREAARPSRVLIRVPSVERDWLVPLRRELGLWYFSDPTHETEYTPDSLREELARAGFDLAELVQRWGELWAVAAPARQTPGAILSRS